MGVTPVLAAESVVRVYGGRRVVDVERLAVAPGEVLAVLGPNGAGKSTLFRILLLLERPDRGRVLLDGAPLSFGDAAARRRLAGVFQRPTLFTGTVASNLRFGLRASGVPRGQWAARLGRALADLGLAALADTHVRRLSGGEAQRVALARALVLEPDVLLLDEPTANLDVTIRRRFRDELAPVLRERARSVVLITHDPAEAFDLADRVAVLEAGRLVQTGTPEDLAAEPATPFVAEFTGAELLLDGVVAAAAEGTVEVRVGDAVLVARAPAHPVPPGSRVHIRYRPEDVLLAPPDAEHVAGSGVSARNRLALRVRSLAPAGGLVRVRLEGSVDLAALVTRRSADELGLRPGAPTAALLKTAALHVHEAADARLRAR